MELSAIITPPSSSLCREQVFSGSLLPRRLGETRSLSPWEVEPRGTTNTHGCCRFPLKYTVLCCGWAGLGQAPSLYCCLWAASWSVRDVLTHGQYDHTGTPASVSLHRIAHVFASPRTRYPVPLNISPSRRHAWPTDGVGYD